MRRNADDTRAWMGSNKWRSPHFAECAAIVYTADPVTGGLMPATEEEMRKAFKAFKKRLKLTQLEEDSRLGRSPLTGARSQIVSIQPPAGFGRDIWEQLADAGYLVRDGGGFYSVVAGK
jgi:hypothetical protein